MTDDLDDLLIELNKDPGFREEYRLQKPFYNAILGGPMATLENVRDLVRKRWPTFSEGLQLQIADFCNDLYQQGYVAGEKAVSKSYLVDKRPKDRKPLKKTEA